MGRFRYISAGEERLNRGLWVLFAIGLLYSVIQHVWLADVPERIPDGARWGDLFYDLAIAYVGAFVFYLLVVRIPLLRDRRNVYHYVEMLLWWFGDYYRGLVGELDRMSRVSDHREQTPDEHAMARGDREATVDYILGLCSRIGPEQDVNVRDSMSSNRSVAPIEILRTQIERGHKLNRELQTFAPYLAAEVVTLLAIMDLAPIEQGLGYVGVQQFGGEPSMAPVAHPLTGHLAAAWKLNAYRCIMFGDRTLQEMSADLEAGFRGQ